VGERLDVQVTYAARRPWVPRRTQFSRWAEAALAAAASPSGADSVELSVRVVGSARSRSLNARYRQKDKSTNVLSFAGVGVMPDRIHHLGELVICAPVVAQEAVSQGKAAEFHWAHMTVHGVLHLLGFDHEGDAEARKMEAREVQILDRLGFSNPYV
jgi:probable rRNA maturation factor